MIAITDIGRQLPRRRGPDRCDSVTCVITRTSHIFQTCQNSPFFQVLGTLAKFRQKGSNTLNLLDINIFILQSFALKNAYFFLPFLHLKDYLPMLVTSVRVHITAQSVKVTPGTRRKASEIKTNGGQ